MKIFLGTDICETSRIQSLYEKYGEKFLRKIFTDTEKQYCFSNKRNTFKSLAARFAAKEAVSKALETGINGPGWDKGIDFKDVEVIRAEAGSITLALSGKALAEAQKKSITNWTISVSHSENYATATVIGYKE